MDYIQWQPAFNVNHPVIDKQHRYLVQVLNETHELMMSYADFKLFYQKVLLLRKYARIHFDSEEAIMEEIGYPDLKNHKIKHNQFIDELDNLEKILRKGKKSAPAEVFMFVKFWLLEHIQITDRDYSYLLK